MAKYDRLATKLSLEPDDRVIEIGTGWGGFAIHLAEHYGCRVTTTTISEAQRSFAEKRVADHGLADRVTVLGADYRELRGTYDALVSVEMIEAVDWRRHDEFFATCARLLEDHGRMGLQAITIADASFERAKLHDDFVRAMVFPGGCLPSLTSMSQSLARTSDLRVVDLEDIGMHYAETLRRWRANLATYRHEMEQLGFDERFWRFWNLYLCYCEAAFLERHISDLQLVLARPEGRWWTRSGARPAPETAPGGSGPTGRDPGTTASTASAVRLGVPFCLVHLALLGLVLVGWSVVSVATAALLYGVRALGITVIYHRGLTHKSYRMGRGVQAVGAVVATSAAQRGPLWWVAHHRVHHRFTDRPGDPHSPVQRGLLWSHVSWMFSRANMGTDLGVVRDLAAYRELRLLDRFHHLVPVALAASLFGVGVALGHIDPALGVNGPQLVVWGFCVSTVLLWHSTFAVNSLGHRFGRRPYATRDASRNLWWLALLTMGEGWHNNHHRYPASARQGLGRFEVDPSWWTIRTLARLRLVRDVRTAPRRRSGQRDAESGTPATTGGRGPGRDALVPALSAPSGAG